MKPTIRLLAIPICLAVAAALATLPAGARSRRAAEPAPSAPIVKTKKIAPGLVYKKIVQKQVPRRTFVLKLDLTKAITLDTTLADAALPARKTVSEIVRAHEALAGVNGDYAGTGNPVHPFAQDGDLLHTAEALGTLFAVSRDESQVFFGRPDLSVSLTDLTNSRAYTLDRWNQGPPAPGELAGFSPLGGTLEVPPPFACSVRLLPQGTPRPAEGDGVDSDFVVDETACSEDPITRDGGIVISAAPATEEATELLALQPGTAMRLHWSLGWPNVFDAVGGAPLILLDGAPVGECNSGCGRQPRTGVGVTANGKILLVVVDGRQASWSLGPTVDEFAQIMAELGAVTALNLDGGGSSEMVVEGEVVNRPSDGQEREISNAILVLPGADPDEP